MAPLILTKLVLPQMIERGSGIDHDITSAPGRGDPPAPAGDGGWGLGYGMSKGAVHRLVGIVKLEHEQRRHPRLQPAPRLRHHRADDPGHGRVRLRRRRGAPADVIGAAAAWLCTAPEARELNGQWIEGQELTARLGSAPGWDAPSGWSACRRATGSTRSRTCQLRTVTVSVSRRNGAGSAVLAGERTVGHDLGTADEDVRDADRLGVEPLTATGKVGPSGGRGNTLGIEQHEVGVHVLGDVAAVAQTVAIQCRHVRHRAYRYP